MAPAEIAAAMARCDREAQEAVEAIAPAIAEAIAAVAERVAEGGRVFYLGAGTSGRLGILDASEIPPTFGVEGTFIGLIAGGDGAIRKAVEGAEDDRLGGVRDLESHGPLPAMSSWASPPVGGLPMSSAPWNGPATRAF